MSNKKFDAKNLQTKLENIYKNIDLTEDDKDLLRRELWSIQMQERMKDPALVHAIAEGNRKKAKDPEWLDTMYQILSERHSNPNWLEKMKELGEKKSNDPEFLAKMNVILKERAKDPKWRETTKKASQERSKKKSWKEANKKANRDPNKIEHQKQFVTGRNSTQYKGDYIGTCIKTGKEIRAIGAKGLKELGFSPGMVSECCSGKRDTAKGYRWRREKI
jgi:hypothetical protein